MVHGACACVYGEWYMVHVFVCKVNGTWCMCLCVRCMVHGVCVCV